MNAYVQVKSDKTEVGKRRVTPTILIEDLETNLKVSSNRNISCKKSYYVIVPSSVASFLLKSTLSLVCIQS